MLKWEKWGQERRAASVTAWRVAGHPGSRPWFQLDPIISLTLTARTWGVPGASAGEESACNAGDADLTPGTGRAPGGGNSSPLQHSCLGHPMDRGAWQAAVHGVTKSRTQLGDRARVHTQPAQTAHTAKGHTHRTEGSDENHTKKPTVKSEYWWSFSGENCTPKIKTIRAPT